MRGLPVHIIRTGRDMALFVAIWAAMALLRLAGRELALTPEEREALLGRVEAALAA